ncbi:MAG: endonuclease domain-containing protein [Patescibacteria group bacterium]|jgi:hypothetical protein
MNPILTSAKQFIFRSYAFDRVTGEVKLTYAIDDDEFIERLVLPIPSTGIPDGIDDVLDRALFALHLVAGVSYYKAKLPPEIIVESGDLSHEQAEFWNTLYTLGLGEFFYRNELDFREYIQFPVGLVTSGSLGPNERAHDLAGALLPIGGGKDSLVAVEMLRAAEIPFDLVMFGNHSRIREVSAEVGKSLMSISRTIDPKLVELNKAGAWNGHVPITAYVGIASMIVALLHGKRDVIFANERSASTGNTEFEGVVINHQYSKSFEAEQDLQSYISSFITSEIRVFSLLRPMSELDISRRFAANGKYFGVFSSCNKNFKQGGVPSVTRWCGKCPKCAFVFVMLAAFIPRRRMVEMFGEDLLMRTDLLEMYKDLTGYGAMKPFECVGEFEEVIAAFALIEGRGEYDDSPIMQWFVSEVMSVRKDIDALIDGALTLSRKHSMPEEYAKIVYASR